MNLFGFLLPIAIDIIKSYINSTSTKSDDKVLDIVKVGAKYLANNDTTSVSNYEAEILAQTEIKQNGEK